MKTYYLAIDIGASSGRHILGSVKDGKIQIEEIYRFENNLEKHGDSLCWNIENLFTEVKNGLKKCSEIGKIPKTVAVDTWGVDYVLLDENKNEILPSILKASLIFSIVVQYGLVIHLKKNTPSMRNRFVQELQHGQFWKIKKQALNMPI